MLWIWMSLKMGTRWFLTRQVPKPFPDSSTTDLKTMHQHFWPRLGCSAVSVSDSWLGGCWSLVEATFRCSIFSPFTTFLSKSTDYISHMLLQRWKAKIRRKAVASTGDQTHNHQVISPTRSPLSHPGGACRLAKSEKISLTCRTTYLVS